MGRVDIITGTLGKALGGASGGYTSGRREIIELLRQRSRPYLFSNALPPMVLGAALKAIELARDGEHLRERLFANARAFRSAMGEARFNLLPGEHPIIPVMLGEAKLAQEMAARLYEKGIYVTGFFYPVVPQGQARIRTQMSAAHSPEDVGKAVAAFAAVGREMGAIR
jgi:glycine C-acetyltransferase